MQHPVIGVIVEVEPAVQLEPTYAAQVVAAAVEQEAFQQIVGILETGRLAGSKATVEFKLCKSNEPGFVGIVFLVRLEPVPHGLHGHFVLAELTFTLIGIDVLFQGGLDKLVGLANVSVVKESVKLFLLTDSKGRGGRW